MLSSSKILIVGIKILNRLSGHGKLMIVDP